MFLAAFAFLFDLLLLLQFLGDASFTQGLSLAAFISLGVERRLQCCVTPHTHYDLLTQLSDTTAMLILNQGRSQRWKLLYCFLIYRVGEDPILSQVNRFLANRYSPSRNSTCLWKLRSLSALSSMVALVLRSPAREPGIFSSSWIRCAIRACSLLDTRDQRIDSKLSSDTTHIQNGSVWATLPVLSLLQNLHRVEATGFLNGCDAILFGVNHHGRRLRRLSRRLGLWGHDGRGGGGYGGRRRRGTTGGLWWDQLLRSAGGSSSVNHGSYKRYARYR